MKEFIISLIITYCCNRALHYEKQRIILMSLNSYTFIKSKINRDKWLNRMEKLNKLKN